MAKQVRLTLAKAIARANLRRAEAVEKATTIMRLARNDDKVASALSLELVVTHVTVLVCVLPPSDGGSAPLHSWLSLSPAHKKADPPRTAR